jgi:hypothetical protein
VNDKIHQSITHEGHSQSQHQHDSPGGATSQGEVLLGDVKIADGGRSP